MRQEQIYEDDDDEDFYRGPSKSQLKREQDELQNLGKEMTKLGDDQLKRIGLPEEVLAEIVEFRRMKSFGAQRRQLQLIGKKMRNMDPKAVREAIDRVTGDSKAAVALLHRCETLRDQMLAGDDAVTRFIGDNPDVDIPKLRTRVRNARQERALQKAHKAARELDSYLHELLEEPLTTHFSLSQGELNERILWISGAVGISADQLDRYPHQFSGGQRQRIAIARALITRPRFVVADEPVSALDVSIQAQVLNLLMSLQAELGLSYLFISHDLNVVRHISNRVGVMYLGRIVETGETEEVYTHPLHPYTQALLSAIPRRDPSEPKTRIHLQGDVPSPANPPSGCPFHNRCPRCMGVCKETMPPARDMGGGHWVSCHLVD